MPNRSPGPLVPAPARRRPTPCCRRKAPGTPGRRQVDVYETRPRPLHELVGVAQRPGRYSRGQPVAGVVGEPDGIVEVAGPNDGENGTEDLLLRGLRAVVHVGDDGRGDVVAIVLRTGSPAIEYHASLVLRLLKGIENTIV